MTPRKKILFLLCPLLLAALPARLPAGEKFDLDRVTPVPADQPIPIVDFFRPPILRNPKLNLAGTHIAAIISPSLDHTELMVYDLKTQQIERLGARGDSEIYHVDWLNSKRLIYQISVKKLAGTGLFAGEVGALTSSYPLTQYIGSYLIAVPPNDRTHPLVHLSAHSLNTGQYGEVVTIRSDIDTGIIDDGSSKMRENNEKHILVRHPVLKSNEGSDFRYLADKEGQLKFGMKYSDDGQMSLHQLVGEDWKQCPEDLEEIDVVDCGDNPGEIVVVGQRDGTKPRPLEVMDAATGKPGEVLLQDKAYDFDGWLYRDPVSHNIVGAVYNRSGPSVAWFNEDYRQLQKVLDGFFPGLVVRILGSDEGGKIFLVSTFSDRQPSIYNWVNLEKHTAGLFKNSSPWIDPKRMQPMNVMKFKTRDGKQLDAYVTMPAGASKQNPPPLVVLPHGGPFYRDTWGYNEEVQFLASRGYAVLQPNYRGSPGYNWMFPTEDEWAFRKMSDDVTDATKTLVASGLVDRSRVAIMGTSFGGFLALSGAAFEPGLYRCAVAVSASYDWGKLIEENKYFKYSDPFYVRMMHKLGDPKKDPEKFDAIAPLRHADQIRAAVLLSHGEYDDSFEIGQSKQLISSLERNHVPVESISFSNEGRGIHRLNHKVEFYSRLETFLAKYLMPTTTP